MKNMFSSIIRIAAAVSAIILLTMCSKQETEPVNSSLDVIQVTVDASVASIDTKSSFAEKKITIEDGDKLQVVAYQIEGSSYTYKYTGTLTNTADAPGTFSGTLERDPDYGSYSGSNFLQDAAAIATLIPNGVDTPVEFLEGISNENIAKLCTMQATKEAGDAPTFALEPSVSVARFTINGLGDLLNMQSSDLQSFDSPAYILVKYVDNNSEKHAVEGVASVTADGVATFSVAIASEGTVKSLTLGIHGNTESDNPRVHHDNQVWYDGIIIVDEEKELKDIINITRTPVKTKYSGTATFGSDDLGKIFSTNCHLYTSVATAKAAGTTPMCMVTCIKSMLNQYDSSVDPDMSKGLGMGLNPIEVDGQTKITWAIAKANTSNALEPYFSGHTVIRRGLPSVRGMERMAQCFGGSGGLTSIGGDNFGRLSGNGIISFNSKGLSNKLDAAVEAATGTSFSINTSNHLFGFWTNAYYEDPQSWTIKRPIIWQESQFEPRTDTDKSYAFVYYQF